jgi:3-methyladenine DNA glycosylase AlkD
MKLMTKRDEAFTALRRSIVSDLRQHVEPAYRRGAEKYIKEGIVLYGVRIQMVRKISARYYRKVKGEGVERVLALCDSLVRSEYAEEKVIAFDWAYRSRKQYQPVHFRLFQSWLKEHVGNWGACDDLCRHAFGALVHEFPQFLPAVLKWTASRNRWLRRGAGVIMIYSLRKGKHLVSAFKVAHALLQDKDYLVQNGCGWMLKDASILFPDEVFRFVMKNRKKMSRRTLRYAIERFDARNRKRIME